MKPASVVIPLLRRIPIGPLVARAINLDRREIQLERKRQARREREREMEALRLATPDPPPPAPALLASQQDVELVPYPVLAPGRAQARPRTPKSIPRVVFKSNPEVFFHEYLKRDHDGAPVFERTLIGIEVPPMPSHAKALKVAGKRASRPAVAGGEELYAMIVGLKR